VIAIFLIVDVLVVLVGRSLVLYFIFFRIKM